MELALASLCAAPLIMFGVVWPLIEKMRGHAPAAVPDGDHARDGLGCHACGHTPDQAGLRPWPRRSGVASCWAGVDASGWGDYCGCTDPFHAS